MNQTGISRKAAATGARMIPAAISRMSIRMD